MTDDRWRGVTKPDQGPPTLVATFRPSMVQHQALTASFSFIYLWHTKSLVDQGPGISFPVSQTLNHGWERFCKAEYFAILLLQIFWIKSG